MQGWQLARIVQSVMGDGLAASLWNASGDELEDSDDYSDDESRGGSDSGNDDSSYDASALPRLRLRVRTHSIVQSRLSSTTPSRNSERRASGMTDSIVKARVHCTLTRLACRATYRAASHETYLA